MKAYTKRSALLWSALVLLVLLLSSPSLVCAQLRIVGSISGVVQDQTGAVIPGVQVSLTDATTGIIRTTISTENGTFLFPDLASGSYEITVTKPGFQTSRLQSVSVSTSQTTDVRITMQVGPTSSEVTVSAETVQVLETSSQLMADTLTSKTITELPLANRGNVLALARLAPGASPPTGGDTRYNNLPGGAVNVTVDGINDASNGFKSGGTVFYMTVPVRLGAVEEVSVESGGLSADSGAQSGANIKFTTRRGGQEYHGSVFYEPQSERFNANTWSRNAQGLSRVFNRTQNYGANFGGPLIPAGSLKKKMFVFLSYERQYQPITTARTITVLTPEAQQGIFTYLASGTTNDLRKANVLDLAAAKGFPIKVDPVVQSILGVNNKIGQYAAKVPSVNDFNHDTYTWNAENNNYAYFPAVRVDAFVTPRQQLTFTWNYWHNWQPGEKRLPIPDVNRTNPFRLGYFVWSAALQSTLSPTTFNEFRYGVQHSGDTNRRAEYGLYYQYNDTPLRIGATLPFGPTVPFIDQANTTGRHFITTIQDTLTLTRGRHTMTAGGSYRKTDWKDIGQVFPLPTYGTGAPSGDPLQISTAYTTTTLPGINSTELANPLALYNLLTGRVSTANFTKVVNPSTFKYDGFENFTWTRSQMGGAFVQDRWRMKPSLTVNAGLRWEVQGPMYDVKGLAASPDKASLYGPSTQLFSPGALSGNNNPTLQVGRVPYNTDWLNLAPNLGFAWNPTRTEGLLGKLMGGSKTVIRGYFGLIVYDEGTQFFAANIGPNAGKTISATALVPGQPGQTALPAFYTLSDVIASPLSASSFAFPATDYKKVYNLADSTFDGRTITGMDPTLRAPYTENYNFGIERQLWNNGVIEVRYVGNQAHLSWRTSNLNEVNIFENGFLQEFKNAQNNLAINAAAGVSSFQNAGRAGQTALPIFDAAFGARGSLAAIAAGNGYASTAFITNLQNGEAGALANTLATNQNYVCRMFGSSFSPCARVQPAANAPGAYPINFFLLNPYVAGRMNYVDDTGWSNYNSLQVQFRQRFRRANWTTNYTWSKSLTNLAVDTQNQNLDFVTLRDIGQSRRVSPFDIRHVIQTFGTYDLPVGRGRWRPVNNRVLNGVVGDWTLGSVFIVQSGAPIQLTGGGFQTVNTTNAISNGVRLAPGVTFDQIADLFNSDRTRLTGRAGSTDLQRLAVDPKLIGPDGRANPQYLIPNATPGDFGQILFLRDKNTFTWNVSMTKNFSIEEKGRLTVFASFNNVLNHPRWGFPDANAFSQTFGVVNGAAGGNRTINLRATLSF
jgi:hypothetical protein